MNVQQAAPPPPPPPLPPPSKKHSAHSTEADKKKVIFKGVGRAKKGIKKKREREKRKKKKRFYSVKAPVSGMILLYNTTLLCSALLRDSPEKPHQNVPTPNGLLGTSTILC